MKTFPFYWESRDFIGFLLIRDLNVTLHGICERSLGSSKDVPNMVENPPGQDKVQGSLKYPFGGDQPMQMYGDFEGFPLVHCLGW